jgi:3-oxoacyl-(acyl-carrier-protein) synthase
VTSQQVEKEKPGYRSLFVCRANYQFLYFNRTLQTQNSRIWSPLPETDFSLAGLTSIEQKNLDKSSIMALSATVQALDSANLKYEIKSKKDNTYTITSIDSI